MLLNIIAFSKKVLLPPWKKNQFIQVLSYSYIGCSFVTWKYSENCNNRGFGANNKLLRVHKNAL